MTLYRGGDNYSWLPARGSPPHNSGSLKLGLTWMKFDVVYLVVNTLNLCLSKEVPRLVAI